MKKLRYLLLLMFILSVSLSSVYAGWSQTIDCKLDVSLARFCFDIEASQIVIDDYTTTNLESFTSSRSKINDNTVNIYLYQIQPNQVFRNKIIITNTGTVGAKASIDKYNPCMQFPLQSEYSIDGYTFLNMEDMSNYIDEIIIDPGKNLVISVQLDTLNLVNDQTSEDIYLPDEICISLPFKFVLYNQ